MTLAEVKEVTRHAKNCGMKPEYKHNDVFVWSVVIMDEEFISKKLAVKYIDRIYETRWGIK